jgi:hypothetical protein
MGTTFYLIYKANFSMKEMKISILLCFLNIYAYCQVAGSWACAYTWQPASGAASTNITLGTVTPDINGAKGRFPSKLNLTVDFTDPEWGTRSTVGGTCVPGWYSVPNASYTVEFSIVSFGTYASFNLPTQVLALTKNINLINRFGIQPGSGYNLFRASIDIYFLQEWSIPVANQLNNVVITYKIIDNTPPIPLGGLGNVRDTPINGQWNIKYDNGIEPTTIINLAPPNPADNIWYTASSKNYHYAVGPDIGNDKLSDYTGKIINEELAGPFDGGIFTFANLLNSYLINNPHIVNTQMVLDDVFTPAVGTSHSWYITQGLFHQDIFNTIDTHGGMNEIVYQKATRAFNAAAMNSGNIGYRINQSYKCNGNVLGTTTILKRLINDVDEFQKNHNF